MGIYIHGMEMPKNIEPGLVIEFADGIDDKRYARLYHYRHGGLTEWLEAVPVLPHGRLGDLGELSKELKSLLAKYPPNSVATGFLTIFASTVDLMPTIIPAEEEENHDKT